MADTDILQAISIIDAKIASLQDARNRLASAFGVTGSDTQRRSPASTPARNASANANVPSVPSVPRAPSAVSPPSQSYPRGRKEQLAQYLMENGPMSRGEIAAESGIPEGTVSYCLNDKRFFVQLDGGNWDITEFSRRGLTRNSSKEPTADAHEG